MIVKSIYKIFLICSVSIAVASCAETSPSTIGDETQLTGTIPASIATCDIVIDWTPGQSNINIAGYKIYYDTSPGVYTLRQTIVDSSATQTQVTGLEESVYYISIVAFNELGIESDYADEYFFSCAP